MTELIEADTRLEAWISATKPLLDTDYKQDIILHINSPSKKHSLEDEICEKLDTHYDNADMDPINTIAETIFPASLYRDKNFSIEEVYDDYLEQLEIILQRSNGYNWGTYFERMIQRIDPETGDTFNPLQKTIEKLDRANSPEGHPFKACYEINLQGTSSDVALYQGASDRQQTRNLPCLSHLSFKLFDETVHLTAFYRSHDYRFKVPGNLLGLARLQDCVANEVEADSGQLVIHSSKASIASGPPEGEFRTIVDNFSKSVNNTSLGDF
ncbi:hypothetical protein [Haloarcula marina]|uniref:hypothetical protein n=1 Tax=Haloarcula marina TaxID=2961574 RepID=UPI0020B8436E|nr:hypothetical protein [Halomicroarcula marina]